MVTSSISIGAALKFPEVALTTIRILVIAPTAPSKSRVDAIVAAVSLGDMLDLVLLQCDEEQQHVLGMRHGLGVASAKAAVQMGFMAAGLMLWI